jgi:hypothetical protein
MIKKLDGTFRLSLNEILSKPEEEVDPRDQEQVYRRYLVYKDFAQRILRLELKRKLRN